MPSDAWLVLEVLASNTTYSKSGAAVFASVALAGSGGSPARKWLRNMRSVHKIAQRWICKMHRAETRKRCSSFWERDTWMFLPYSGTPYRDTIYYNVMDNFWTVCVLSNSDPAVLSVTWLLVLRLCHLGLLEYTETFEPSLTHLPTIEDIEDTHNFGSESEDDADTTIYPATDWPKPTYQQNTEVIRVGWTHVVRAVGCLPECVRSIALMSLPTTHIDSILEEY